MPTTESLFLLLSAGAVLLAIRGRVLGAALVAALASATRPNGVLLAIPLAILWWSAPDRARRLPALALVPGGLAAFSAYLWRITGEPLAFSKIQVTFSRGFGFFLAPLWKYMRSPLPVATDWNFRALNFTGAIVGLWASVFWARRRQWALAALSAARASTMTVRSMRRSIPLPVLRSAAPPPAPRSPLPPRRTRSPSGS